MRRLSVIFLASVFIAANASCRAQVFGYSGASWLFHNTPIDFVCFDTYENWLYQNDTTILGKSTKHVHVTKKIESIVPNIYNTFYADYFFYVSLDTVSIFVPSDSTWQELFNFSLQIGDTTHSPLLNSFGFGYYCPDSIPYLCPAIVIDTGTSIISSQPLRYYTVKYLSSSDTTHQFITYYERIITLSYWYPYDSYYCAAVNECTPINLVCYKDIGMSTDTLCNDLTWFQTLSINEISANEHIQIYPNPTADYLYIKSDFGPESYFIISIDGKYSQRYFSTNPINVSDLKPGLYFIMNENKTWFKKFIKS